MTLVDDTCDNCGGRFDPMGDPLLTKHPEIGPWAVFCATCETSVPPTQPPADTASTGAGVEALARVLHDWVGGCCVERFEACVFDGTVAREEAARLLAYPAMRDMLAAHDAATAERVRRETAEGIAAAIEAVGIKHPNQPCECRGCSAFRYAISIAREQAR